MAGPLIVADGPWLLYRSFFALPQSIVDREGRPVNAILGTVNTLESVVAVRSPRSIVVCMGAEEADFRVELYPSYHADRAAMPQALAEQWRRAPTLWESLGWTVIESEKLEADDVMYSIALIERGEGGRTVMITGDRDLYQCVGPEVEILDLRGDPEVGAIDVAGVRERCGVSPEMITDLIALRGDPSDGLPGARGVGKKTAAELLNRYGSLEGVLDAVDRPDAAITPRIRQSLRSDRELLRVFKRIATLVEIEVRRPADRMTDYLAGARCAQEMGMERLAARLRSKSATPESASQ